MNRPIIPDYLSHSDDAYEAIRAFNHSTHGRALPPPFVYDTLGNLQALANLMPQGLSQVATGLARAPEELDMTGDAGGDALDRIATTNGHLGRAAELAAQLGSEIELAQSAIRSVGYRNA